MGREADQAYGRFVVVKWKRLIRSSCRRSRKGAGFAEGFADSAYTYARHVESVAAGVAVLGFRISRCVLARLARLARRTGGVRYILYGFRLAQETGIGSAAATERHVIGSDWMMNHT